MENIFAFQAIQKLVPNADCIIGETYESINWAHESRGKPTEAEFDEALASIKAEFNANQYQRDRASEYPSITDVVVALAEKQEGDSTMWDDITVKRQEVKIKYPKG